MTTPQRVLVVDSAQGNPLLGFRRSHPTSAMRSPAQGLINLLTLEPITPLRNGLHAGDTLIIGQTGQSTYGSLDQSRVQASATTTSAEASPVASIESAKDDGVLVTISTDAIAALQLSNANANPNSDAPPSSVTSSTEIVATPVPKFDDNAWAAAYQAQLARGEDLRDIARTLGASMTRILQRPNIGNAKFDIQTHDGKIQVVSTDMSASDRQWVEAQLNSNTALVNAMRSFHDHTVDNYTLLAKAFGKSLTADQVQQASDWTDKTFKYMDLLQEGVGEPVRQTYRDTTGLTFRDAKGNKVDLPEKPNTAVGLAAFVHRLQALDGSAIRATVTASGHATIMRFNDPFALAGLIVPRYIADPNSTAAADVAARTAN